ncbi:protein Wnt-11b-2-like [Schistocerca cancellata]|uniref:protein Wnt-11b-2-like n=1 Tax=Schistocerca cancellata TaxID=274614 RepID=UPI002118CCA7|nr:protein Wnt-11b-2-like [Schistocerca cancellata]
MASVAVGPLVDGRCTCAANFGVFIDESPVWALGRAPAGAWAVSGACRRARASLGLARRQARLCRSADGEAMPHVARAAALAAATCQALFADRRWNCSSVNSAPAFSRDLTTGTREQAYVYALSSAAVAHAVARACAAGTLRQCGCALPPRDPPNGNFKWGGCGDNLKWGLSFARRFTDPPERRSAKEKPKSRSTVAPAPASGGSGGSGRLRGRVRRQLAAVNLHNNRAGRLAVEASVQTQCKCHGVSGSCNIKTCWRALPPLADVGERLKRRFAVAAEVVSRRVGAGRRLLPAPAPQAAPAAAARAPFSHHDLIYVTKSPDYCQRDPRVGSVGTKHRICNTTSHGYDSCNEMCCGRGHYTVTVERVERCHCKYYWCCYVKCKTCRYWEEVHRCN